MSALFGDHWSCDGRHDRPWQANSLAAAPLVLAPSSTRLPPDLVDRLRLAAPPLGLRQGEIAAAAIDRFLTDYGF